MRLIDADALVIMLGLKPDEWNTPDERWRPESEFGLWIINAPTAEPKRGRWIQKSKPLELCTYWWRECSVCGNKPPNDIYGHPNYLSPYCPNCGAKMEADE